MAKKPSFGPDFAPYGPNSGWQIFFFKNLASWVTRYHGQLSSCTISEKANDPILRKLSDRRTDGWRDRFRNRLSDEQMGGQRVI